MPECDERYMWEVPDEDVGGTGILLSDRIAFYADAVKLVDPLDRACLRPASYDLKVGDSYYFENRPEKVGPDGKIEIPPNGLVYIKIKERLNLPYYMIAKYSLRVTQVYRGLLIDNGLQVDPGYHGYIHVVVHNLTNEPRPVYKDEPFVSVEFNRSTPFKPHDLRRVKTEKDLITTGYVCRGFSGNRLVLFTKRPEDLGLSREPSHFWPHGERNLSSTMEMREQIRTQGVNQSEIEKSAKARAEQLELTISEARAALERTINQRTTALEGRVATEQARLSKFRNFSIGGAAVGALALIAFIFTFFYWFSDRYSELQTRVSEATSMASQSVAAKDRELEVRTLKETVAGLEQRISGLEKAVREKKQ